MTTIDLTDNPTTDTPETGLAKQAPANDPALERPPESLRYHAGINALYREAQERSEVGQLADELARALAWIVFTYDSHAITADVLRRFAGHLNDFEQHRLAEQALALRKAQGQPLH